MGDVATGRQADRQCDARCDLGSASSNECAKARAMAEHDSSWASLHTSFPCAQ
jgi:hypothetical protein